MTEKGRPANPRSTQEVQTRRGGQAKAPAGAVGYRPEDDTYCWVCEGAVTKRHCKIICFVCGFTRDCSDP